MKLNKKSFIVGFVSGVVFMIMLFLVTAYWFETHPIGDCDTCVKITTP